MALVSFTDSSGRGWRAWNVDRAWPQGGSADFLEASFREGWLVFESTDGLERRRLGGFPRDWAILPPAELERLCAEATPATRLGALGRAEARQIRSDTDSRPR